MDTILFWWCTVFDQRLYSAACSENKFTGKFKSVYFRCRFSTRVVGAFWRMSVKNYAARKSQTALSRRGSCIMINVSRNAMVPRALWKMIKTHTGARSVRDHARKVSGPKRRSFWFCSKTCLPSLVNSLWPSDAIWWHWSGSALAQVMACCLRAPSHYLNQCRLIISMVHLHSYEGSFTRDTSAIDH